jgi:hypothetical protein
VSGAVDLVRFLEGAVHDPLRVLNKGGGGPEAYEHELLPGKRRRTCSACWQTRNWDSGTPAMNEAGDVMTYYEAALQVLRSVQRPLTTREITDQAIERGLITPIGKTPHSTMSAELYLRVRNDPELVKLEDPGRARAKHGSVRWTLRRS